MYQDPNSCAVFSCFFVRLRYSLTLLQPLTWNPSEVVDAEHLDLEMIFLSSDSAGLSYKKKKKILIWD